VEREEVRKVVRTTLAVFARIANRTRTQADDLLVAMLRAQEDRLVDAVVALVADPNATLTDDIIAKALEQVGIRV
jgi:hypothetical protein